MTPGSAKLRERLYATEPCLAHIIDWEDPSWDPTVDYGGGHGNTSESYGLPQANPGTKMAVAGPRWRTDPFTQLRWMRRYVKKYGGPCQAWAYRQTHVSY